MTEHSGTEHDTAGHDTAGHNTAGHSHGTPDEPSAGDCVDYLERIVYFLDNELDEADCSAVRMHLDACNPCLERYDLQRTVKAIVARSCSEPAPDEVRRRVLLRIREVQVHIADA
jgi:mycothiol system anti-sigma-R factor